MVKKIYCDESYKKDLHVPFKFVCAIAVEEQSANDFVDVQVRILRELLRDDDTPAHKLLHFSSLTQKTRSPQIDSFLARFFTPQSSGE